MNFSEIIAKEIIRNRQNKKSFHQIKIIITDIIDKNIKDINIIEEECFYDDLPTAYKYAIEYSIIKDRIGMFKLLLNKVKFDGNLRSLFERIDYDIPQYMLKLIIQHSSYRIFTFLKNKLDFKFSNIYEIISLNIKSKSPEKYQIYDHLLNFYFDNNYEYKKLLDLLVKNEDIYFLNKFWLKYKNELLDNLKSLFIKACQNNDIYLLDWTLKINSSYDKINFKTAYEGFEIACHNLFLIIIMRLEYEIHINHQFRFTIGSKKGFDIFKLYVVDNITKINDPEFFYWLNNLKIYRVQCFNCKFNIMTKLKEINSSSYKSIPNRLIKYILNDSINKTSLMIEHFNTKSNIDRINPNRKKTEKDIIYPYIIRTKYGKFHITITENKFIYELLEDTNVDFIIRNKLIEIRDIK